MNIKSSNQLQKPLLRSAHQRASSICHIQRIDFGQEGCFSIPRTNIIDPKRDRNRKKISKSFINFTSSQKQKSSIERHKTKESLKINNELLQYILGEAKQNHKNLAKQKGPNQIQSISKELRKALFQNEFKETMYKSFIIEKKKMTLNKNTLSAIPFQNQKLNFLNGERTKTATMNSQYDYKNQSRNQINQDNFQSLSPCMGKRVSTLPVEATQNIEEQNNQESYLTSHNLIENKKQRKFLFLQIKNEKKFRNMKNYDTIEAQRFHFKKSLCSRNHSRTTNSKISSLSKQHSQNISTDKVKQEYSHSFGDKMRTTFNNLSSVKDIFVSQSKQHSIHNKQLFLKSRKFNSKKKYTTTRRQSLRQCQDTIKTKLFANLILNGRKIEGKI